MSTRLISLGQIFLMKWVIYTKSKSQKALRVGQIRSIFLDSCMEHKHKFRNNTLPVPTEDTILCHDPMIIIYVS